MMSLDTVNLLAIVLKQLHVMTALNDAGSQRGKLMLYLAH